MSTAELKNQIIKSILDLEDITILNRLKELIINDQDWANSISDNEKVGIEMGIKDFKEGRVFSHQSVKKEIQNLFDK